jgi:hypothetical protein
MSTNMISLTNGGSKYTQENNWWCFTHWATIQLFFFRNVSNQKNLLKKNVEWPPNSLLGSGMKNVEWPPNSLLGSGMKNVAWPPQAFSWMLSEKKKTWLHPNVLWTKKKLKTKPRKQKIQ